MDKPIKFDELHIYLYGLHHFFVVAIKQLSYYINLGLAVQIESLMENIVQFR